MIQVVRQKSFGYVISKPLPQRRGFYFHMSAGFYKDIDALTGMSINLVEVDQWLQQFVDSMLNRDSSSAPLSAQDLLFLARSYLEERARKSNTILASLALKEERQWTVSWDRGMAEGCCTFESGHFFESFHADYLGLFKIFFKWQRHQAASTDLAFESLRLLKCSRMDSSAALSVNIEKLRTLIDFELPSGPRLKGLRIVNKSQNYSVSF